MTEWRSIPGYSRFSVSDTGIVRRDVRIFRTPPATLVPHLSQGYPRVHMNSDDGKRAPVHVHVLVMLAFVGPRPAGMHVCHCDGSRDNNSIENLRYDTPTANVEDAVRHGTHARGERSGTARLRKDDVRSIVERLCVTATYAELATQYGVSTQCIYNIARGETWSHLTGGVDRRNGYKFNCRGGVASKVARLARAAAA